MKKFLLSIVMVASLAGCASNNNQGNDIAMAQINQPTFRMECPESGCNFSSFEYNDPNRTVDMPTNSYDVVNNAISATSSVILGIAPYYAISRGFRYMSGDTNVNSSDNSISDSSDNRVIDRSDNSTVDRSTRSTDNSVRDFGGNEQ